MVYLPALILKACHQFLTFTG